MTQPLTTFTSHENAEGYLERCGFHHVGDGLWKYGKTKYRAYHGRIRGGGAYVTYWPEFPPAEAHKSLRDRIGGMAWL